jgi:formate dehydrogenase accessory protein FdhE
VTDGAAILRALSEAMRSSATELPAGVPDLAAAEVRLANGVPALTGEPVLDWAGLVRNASTLAVAMADTAAGDRTRRVVHVLTSVAGEDDEASIAAIALSGAWDGVPSLAAGLQVDGDALLTVLDYAVRPALRAAATAARPVIARVPWARGRCPACGAPPLLSVVSGKERERTLHCARCATAWAFARVRCPACGEENHERLGYVHAAGEGEYRRIEVCDSCGGYVKTLALLDAPPADRLLQLDLETVALDFLALDRGYIRV